MKIKNHIPNAITSLNLVSGCIGIYFTLEGHVLYASYAILIAAIFDFFDGMAARLLHVKSDIGKELDSLADVVSFGVLSGFIAFVFLKTACIPIENKIIKDFLPFVSMIIPVFSALRLAKFNLDTRQTDSFIGVPTPANAMFWGSFPLIANVTIQGSFMSTLIINPYLLICLIFLTSYLLVAELPLFSLKFKSLKVSENKTRFIFLGMSIILIAFFWFLAIPMIIFVYIILSIIENIFCKKQ